MSKKKEPVKIVDILGEKIPIYHVTKVDKDDSDGEFSQLNKAIKIKVTKRNIQGVNRTTAHEKMHALLYISGISSALPDTVEEQLCVLMETGFKVFKDELMKECNLIQGDGDELKEA